MKISYEHAVALHSALSDLLNKRENNQPGKILNLADHSATLDDLAKAELDAAINAARHNPN